MSAHWSSPWRTTGPSGSLEMISGRMIVVVGVLVGRARGGEARGVGGVGVAGPGEELLVGLGVCLDRHRLVADAVRLEEVGEVQLGGGAGLDADRGAVELGGRGDAELLRHHEALAVVVVHPGEGELQVGVAGEGPGGVAREHVDLARGQRGEARLARSVGTNSTFSASPSTAAATARQRATSKPSQLPLGVRERRSPARPVFTPHFSVPRALHVLERRGRGGAGRRAPAPWRSPSNNDLSS